MTMYKTRREEAARPLPRTLMATVLDLLPGYADGNGGPASGPEAQRLGSRSGAGPAAWRHGAAAIQASTSGDAAVSTIRRPRPSAPPPARAAYGGTSCCGC